MYFEMSMGNYYLIILLHNIDNLTYTSTPCLFLFSIMLILISMLNTCFKQGLSVGLLNKSLITTLLFLTFVFPATINAALPSTIDLNSTSADVTIYGDDVDDYSGVSVATGDINGDNVNDIIIGAYMANPAAGNDAGETYIIYGSDNLSSTIDLDSVSADVTIYGDDFNDRSGWSVATGDVNGDNVDDVIIGAYGADPAGGSGAGETYIIYGSDSLPSTIDLNSVSADVTIYGDDIDDESGWSVATGDVNGDNVDDVIIGARYADPAGGSGAGETYIIYGSDSLPATIDLNSTSADVTIYGDDDGDQSGSSVATGDINGDNVTDLIIGARRADPAGGENAGETYIIYGSDSLSSTIDLNSVSADVTIYGDDASDNSVSVTTGDINSDNVDDVIIGSYGADPAGGDNAGETYIIYGSDSLSSTIDLNSVSADVTIYGDDEYDYSGTSVATGDVNGDNVADLIIGTHQADPAGGSNAGETYVIYGFVSNTAPSSPTIDNFNDSTWGADNTPTLQFDLSDPDIGDIIKYQVQIDDNADFSSTVVDVTEGSGSASPRSNVQYTPSALDDGSYYWRVKVIDDNDAQSSWTTANSGAIAFKIDTTSPSTPGIPTYSDSTWSFTASTDAGAGLHATPYTVEWCDNSSFTSCSSYTDTSDTNSYTHSTDLADGTWYFRIKAKDALDNESSYSSNGSTTIDSTAPVSIDLSSPGNDSYTSSSRPTFKWKATSDATSGLSKYKVEIDNPSLGSSQVSGDFVIDNIPVSRTTTYETDKYIVQYENFDDADDDNNYISVYTKSHRDWETSQNDGQLREGRVTWKVAAVDTAGNETSSSRTIFVDRTGPKVELNELNDLVDVPEGESYFATTDSTPTIKGKIIDRLAGGDTSLNQDTNGPRVVSGPREIYIRVEQEKALSSKLLSIYKVNIEDQYYTCGGDKITDNSKQECDKYASFEYTYPDSLELGTYKITVEGKDRVGNSSSQTINLKVTTLPQILTKEELEIIEEELQLALDEGIITLEEKEEMAEVLEITKPTLTATPSALASTGKKAINNGKSVLKETGTLISSIFSDIGSGIGHVGDTAGQGYINLANNSPKAIKTIMLGASNGFTTVTTSTGIAIDNTKGWIAGIAFDLGEKTKGISDGMAMTFIKIGFSLLTEPTSISQVTAIATSPTTAVISWETNQPANGKVNYGLEDGIYSMESQTEERTTTHEFTLTNLEPDTLYHYEVMSHNKNYVYDANRQFRTPE